jgi:Asp-tRNA(Asn)/Glu-tRNA(Gln) amidotransferase A subunit family amidase
MVFHGDRQAAAASPAAVDNAGEFVAANREDVDPIVAEIVCRGARPSAVEAFRCAHRLAELRRATGLDWARIDALPLPTAPTIYRHEQVAADPIATNAALGTDTKSVNLLDLCAVAVPACVRADGLPLGVTLIAWRDQDAELIGLAASWLGEPPVVATAPTADGRGTPCWQWSAPTSAACHSTTS